MSEKTKEMTLKDLNELVEKTVKETSTDLQATVKALADSVKVLRSEDSREKSENGVNQSRLLLAEIEYAITVKKNGAPSVSKAEFISNFVAEKYAKIDPEFVATVQDRKKDFLASGNGGNLVIEEYAQGFIDMLWNRTILGEMGIPFVPTASGNLTIPKILESVSASYVPESGAVDTSTMSFGLVRLSVKKLMALVPISNDLIRYANYNTDAIARDNIMRSMVQAMNTAFVYGKAEKGAPLGIANYVGVQKHNNGTAVKASFDLGLEMRAALGKKNLGFDNLYWVMGWDTFLALQKEVTNFDRAQLLELSQGKWHGIPVIVTNIIKNEANKEDLFLVSADQVVAIQGLAVTLDMSGEASFQTKDGLVNAFAQDFTIIRAIAEHDWKLAYAEAVVHATIDLA